MQRISSNQKQGIAMNKNQTGGISEDFGKLILRVTLALLILFHGVSKVIGGAAFITGMVAKAGFPPALGYLVYVGEVIAPLLVLFGVWARLGGLVIVINMVIAILLVHTSQFFTMSKTGGWALELQALYLVSALAVVLLGAGRYSVSGAGGRWN
jgi:putative oxidoreductase